MALENCANFFSYFVATLNKGA